MSSRIASRFASLKKQGRTALIPFITAGDPQPWVTVPLMHALVQSGADMIELGVPFSDPMAEGPVIQRACERALKNDIDLRGVLDMVRSFRATNRDTPVILMGYLNPVEAMGYETFARDAAAVGVDGVITVDLPPEESVDYRAAFDAAGLDPIFLLAPTSTAERVRLVAHAARGFIYYVSLKGVTGAGHLDVSDVEKRVAEIRRAGQLPVGVGFGINSPEAAARVAGFADAVIVGSALVKRIGDLCEHPERIKDEASRFLSSLRSAIDDATATPVSGIRA